MNKTIQYIEISHELLWFYIGGVTSYFTVNNDGGASSAELIPPKYFQNQSLLASREAEKSLIRLAFLALAFNRDAPLQRYDDSQSYWGQAEMRNLVDQMSDYFCKDVSTKLKDLANQVVLIEMQLEEWRETIKPQILAQFKELGIEA